ncbi:MAG: hypothetical protein GEU97_00815 [Actinophytocola sp.]|nr:hypothetical protein [Actinophytocola sp.]
MSTRKPRRKLTREDYERGLPDYHDPTGGWAGAAPMYSALTLRLWLAGLGAVLCAAVGVLWVAVGVLWVAVGDMVWLGVVMFAVAAGLVVDFGWVLHRKHRGEPG